MKNNVEFQRALYQARMWRGYARTFDGVPTAGGITVGWVQQYLKVDRAACIQRARQAVLRARAINMELTKPRRLGVTYIPVAIDGRRGYAR